jgi:hypothetical protein
VTEKKLAEASIQQANQERDQVLLDTHPCPGPSRRSRRNSKPRSPPPRRNSYNRN